MQAFCMWPCWLWCVNKCLWNLSCIKDWFVHQEKSSASHQTTSWINSQERYTWETVNTLWTMRTCCCEAVYSETLSGALGWLSLLVWMIFFLDLMLLILCSFNTDICCIPPTGLQTKLMQNCGRTTFKRTSIDKLMNTLVLWVSCCFKTQALGLRLVHSPFQTQRQFRCLYIRINTSIINK